MSILAQCGYGLGSKIEKGLDEGVIHGVIMSPRDEKPDRLIQAVVEWRTSYPDSILLFDPQFYTSTLNDPRDGQLREYSYYENNNGLGRTNFSGSLIRRYVKECLDFQYQSFYDNITYFISPTVLFDGFRDFWSQVALNMALESVDYHTTSLNNSQPLLLSFVISETAFQSMDAIEEYLDALTELDVEGFYLIIRRNATSLQNAMEANSYSRFLYFCYVLAEINKYKVVIGYNDWHSFLTEAVGVSYNACGWYQNLRQFSLARFQPPTGGRRPRKRYSSFPLLSCPLILPELQDIYQAGFLPNVLTGSEYDLILVNGPSMGEAKWSEEISCLSHWFSLNTISKHIAGNNDIMSKIQYVEQKMRDAQANYLQLERNGISFDPQTGPDHIVEWQVAFQEFRGILGI